MIIPQYELRINPHMLSAEDLELRSGGIGASEAGAVIGASRWRTPVDVWMEKTGKAQPTDMVPLSAMWWGHALEDTVADAYAEKHGVKLRKRKSLKSKKWPHLLATLDREVVGQRRILEIKTSSPWYRDWGEDGGDDCPYEVVAQVTQQMAVRNWTENPADVALFKTIVDYREYTIEFDHELWEYMLPKLDAFWEHVKSGEPPPAINIHDINTLYPDAYENPLLATEEMMATVHQYDVSKAELKKLTTLVKDLQEQLILQIGPHDVVNDEEGKKVFSYKNIKTRIKIDWEQVALGLFQHCVDHNIIQPDSKIIPALKEKHSTIAGGYRRWHRQAPELT